MITPEEPELAEVISIVRETPDTKTFEARYLDRGKQKKFFFVPGKFMMVSVFGIGEIPISISSSPYKTGSMKFTVVDVGNVTGAMHRLKEGDRIGLRGPFGNGFPMQRFRNKNMVFVSGGCGLAPLRSAIYAVQEKKQEFGRAFVFFGCRSPENLLFKDEQKQWQASGLEVNVTIDKPFPEWSGSTGFVTNLIEKAKLPVENSIVLLCGPPVMISSALDALRKKGFKDGQMFASMERMMQCGVGYCSHCTIGNKYTCIDGPVFSAKNLKEMPVREG